MTYVLLLSMWAIAISSWYTVLYFYNAGIQSKKPDMLVVLRCLAVTAISLFIGCFAHSLIQATIIKGVRF